MRQIMGYYCWIKQVTPETGLKLSAHVRAGGRPPTRKAGKLAFSAIVDDDEDIGDELDPPGSALASPALSLAWAADLMFPGNPTRGVICYKVVSGTRDDALAWIRSDRGQAWRANADQYFLMCFGVNGPAFFDPKKCKVPSSPPLPKGFSPYDEKDWDPEFRREGHRSTYYTKRAWEAIDLTQPLGDADAVVQCKEVVEAMKKWDKQKTQALRENLSAWHAVLPIFEALGHPDPFGSGKMCAIELVGRLIEESLPPLAYFKDKFDLARPAKTATCKIDKTHLEPPRHPSYPSGHATQVWLIALALGGQLKDKKGAIDDAAAAVAMRRVIAGIHFPVDAVAGKELAEKLLKLIESGERAKEFKKLLSDAAAELS